jgi:hypothetical protein
MESKLLQTKDIGDLSSITVCYFGSCTPGTAPRSSMPKRDGVYGARLNGNPHKE